MYSEIIACLYLFNFLSYGVEHHNGVNILAVGYLRDLGENRGFSINEAIQDVFLQSLMVILYSVCLSSPQRVATVREDHRNYLLLIVE